jgi:hypothetical protein
MPLITAPGAYPDIAAEDYHGNPDLTPEPSLSSTGAKTLMSKSPLHFWHASAMNPDRTEQSKSHFNVGKAAHDMILLRDRWPAHYFVTSEGFSRAKTKACGAEIAEADEAAASGLTVLSFDQAETVRQVTEAIQRVPLAMQALTNGVTEETLVWRDPITDRWLRARPDFRPHSIAKRSPVRVVADLKFVAPTNASPSGFAKAIENFGYHQSAAFYWDGIKATFDIEPTHWLHVVVEKEAPFCVSLYELPREDIERGRVLNRRAITLFDRCMNEGVWPGYADVPTPVGLPGWARARIDDLSPQEMAFADAA